MKPILEFKNVKVIYDYNSKENALNIEELIIEHGENVAIIGPNGSGKSTLINLISRDIYPEPDENLVYRIYGKNSWDVFNLRSHLGLVSPNYQHKVEVEATVLDTVLTGFFSSIGIINKGDVTAYMIKKAVNALDFFGISGLADRLMTELSTGQSRLVLIARALVHKPKSLVLDEPTSGLDIKAAHIFRNYLTKLADHGTNIIVVTHQFENIVPGIDRAVILKKGKIFMDGKCDDIITNDNMSKLYSMDIRVKKRKIGFTVELNENNF